MGKGFEVPHQHRGMIKRVLGLSELFAIGYGDLGSSIYYALGITALYALGATPLVLGIAGLVFVCNALSYAELSSMYPESGGSASFARHAFNNTLSFIAGWGLLLDYIVTIAISAFAIAPYLSGFYEPLKHTSIQIWFTVSTIFVLFIMNALGVRQSTRISMVLMAFAILSQIFIICVGALLVSNLPLVIDHFRIGVEGVNWSPSWTEFMHGLAMAMVAYTGIESIAQLGAESHAPRKNLPRAIFLNMIALLVLYFGVSVVGLSVLTPYQLGHEFASDPIAGIVRAFPGTLSMLAPWVGLLAAMILFVASNAGMIGSSRLAFNMGEFYQLPHFFSSLHSRFRTPVVSLGFFGAVACLLVVLSQGRLTFLADLYNFGAMLAFFSTNVSLLALRIKKPDELRPYKIPFNIPFGRYQLPISAIVGALGSLAVWLLVISTKPEGRYLGLAWMVVGTVVFFSCRGRKKISIQRRIIHKIEEAKMPAPVRNILVPVKSIEDRQMIHEACAYAKAHHASLTILHVIEVPSTIPVDAESAPGLLGVSHILHHVEKIMLKMNIPFELSVLRGRTFEEVINEALKEKRWELLMVGGNRWGRRTIRTLRKSLDLHDMRIWICH